MQVRLKKEKTDQAEMVEPYFHGRCHIALKVEDLEQSIKDSNKKVMTSFLEYQRHVSNWTLVWIDPKYCQIQTFTRINFTANQTQSQKRHCNVQNKNQNCFQWAILSALHPADHHAQRVSNYFPYADELDFT